MEKELIGSTNYQLISIIAIIYIYIYIRTDCGTPKAFPWVNHERFTQTRTIKINQIVGVLAFSLLQKVNFVTWYNEKKSTTQTQPIYRQTEQKSPTYFNSILRCVKNVQEHGSVGIKDLYGRPSLLSVDERLI